MATVVQSRTDLLADIDRLGGAEGISLIAGMLPGGGSGLKALLMAGERAVKAGPVYVTIKTADPEIGTVEVEII